MSVVDKCCGLNGISYEALLKQRQKCHLCPGFKTPSQVIFPYGCTHPCRCPPVTADSHA